MDISGRLTNLLHMAPLLSFANDVAGMFTGKPPQAAGDPEKPVKFGIFSREDETVVAKVILGLENEELRDLDVGFLAHVFSPQRKKGAPITFQHFLESLWYRNEFFSHLASLAKGGEPKKKGVERVVVKKKLDNGGGDQTTTTENDLYTEGGGPSKAVKLLTLLGERLKEEKEAVEKAYPKATEETILRKTYDNVYKQYYKNDFTTRIRMVGEDDTRIWERFGITEERWKQFSKWAAPLFNKAIVTIKEYGEDGGAKLQELLELEVARRKQEYSILPKRLSFSELLGKIYHLPRNAFMAFWKRVSPF